MKGRFTLLAFPLLLTACSSQASVWDDARYQTAMETGTSVFNLGHMGQAAGQYQVALQQAVVADNAAAIHDAGFNLATAQLRGGNLKAALATLNQTEAALAVRGWKKTADLHLIRSAVYFRLKNWPVAQTEAVLAQEAVDGKTVEAGVMLEGLSAAELGDLSEVTQAVSRLAQAPKGTVAPGNLEELRAWQAYLSHDWAQAATLAAGAAREWRMISDYAAMRRALGLEARALRSEGRLDAATQIGNEIQSSEKAEAASQNG